MIDNLIKSRFLPRIGLVTGAYVFWAGVFVALSPGDESAAESFVAIPIVLSALLFGVRGAITGSTIGFYPSISCTWFKAMSRSPSYRMARHRSTRRYCW